MTAYKLKLNTANFIEDEDGLDNTNAIGSYKGSSYQDHDDSLTNGGLKFKIPVTYTGTNTLKYSIQSSVTVNGHTFTIKNNKDGTFSLDKSQFQYLKSGEAIKLCISITVFDGCKSVCGSTYVTIVGTNDNRAPCVKDVCYSDDEDGLNTVNPNDTLINTKLVFGFSGNDQDGDTLTYSIKTGTFSSGGQSYTIASTSTAGTYTVTNAGKTFTLKDIGGGKFELLTSEFQYLNAGQTKTLKFQYTANDGKGGTSNTANATVTIYGTEDKHVPSVQNVVYQDDEDGSNLVSPSDTEVNNNLVFSMKGTDEDGDTLTYAIKSGTFTADGKTYTVAALASGSFTVTVDGKTFTGVFNSANGKFSFNTTEFQYLNAGQTKTLVFQYTANDGHGGTSNISTAKTIIHGTDDNSLIASNHVSTDDEDAIDGTGATAIVSGLTVTDNDDGIPGALQFTINNYTHTGSGVVTFSGVPTTVVGSDGVTYHVTNIGNGTFKLTQSEFQHLNAGEGVTLKFNYTISADGLSSTAEAKITIVGAVDNTCPVIQDVTVHEDEDALNAVSPNGTLTETQLKFAFNGTDADGDLITYHIKTGDYTNSGQTYTIAATGTPNHYTVTHNGHTFSLVDNGDGTFQFDPSEFQYLNAGEIETLKFQYNGTAENGGIINHLIDFSDPLTGTAGNQQWGELKIVAKDWDGNIIKAVPYNTPGFRPGIGIGEGRIYEIDYKEGSAGQSESVKVEFPDLITATTVTLGQFYQNGPDTPFTEKAIWKAYDADGNLVAQGSVLASEGTYHETGVHSYNLTFPAGVKSIEFSAAANGAYENSEFIINSIQYTTEKPDCVSNTGTVTVNIHGTDENSLIASNQTFIDDEDAIDGTGATAIVSGSTVTDHDDGLPGTLQFTINNYTHVGSGAVTFSGIPATVVGSDGVIYHVTNNGNGTFTLLQSEFQHLDAGQAVTLTFNYTVSADGLNSTAEAKVVIIGTADNTCPVIKDVTVHEDEDGLNAVSPNGTLTETQLKFAFNGTDADGDPITYHIKTGDYTNSGQTYTIADAGTPGHYTITHNGHTFSLVDNGDGTFQFDPSEFQYLDAGDIETLKFQYEGTAPNGGIVNHLIDFSDPLSGTPGNQQWGDLKIIAKDWDGNIVNAVPYNTPGFRPGIGIGEGRLYEIDYKEGSGGQSESISIEFPEAVTATTVALGQFYENGPDSPFTEKAIWKAYDADGNLVAQGFVTADQGTHLDVGVQSYNLTFPSGVKSIEFSAAPNGIYENSEFILSSIQYTTGKADCISNTGTVTVNIHGTDDNSLIASNQTFIDDEDAVDGTGATAIVSGSTVTDHDDGLPGTLQFTISNYTHVGSGVVTFTGVPATIVGSDGNTYSVINNGNGTFALVKAQYQHLAVGEAVTLTFNYTVSADGLSSTAEAKVIIIGTNDGIDAIDDNAGTINDGDSVALNILANDIDPENEDLDVSSINSLTINGVTIPAGQWSQYFTVDNETGQLVFNSANVNVPAGTSQNVVINYTATDPHGSTDSANVFITVQGDDVRLVASNQSFVDDEDAVDGTGASAIVSGSTVTDNDDGLPGTLQFSINNYTYNGSNPVTFTGVPASVTGSDGLTYNITNNGNGTFTIDKAQYQALSVGEAVVLTFNYTVNAGALSSTAQAKVTIIGTNDGIDAVDDHAGTINDGDSVNVPVLANDTDTDGDDLDLSSINSLTIGGVTIPSGQWSQYFTVDNETGQLVFNSANMNVPAGTSRDVVINYTATDPYGSTDSANVFITVKGDDVRLLASNQTFIDDEDAIDSTGATAVVSGSTVTDHDDGLPGTLQFSINNYTYNGADPVVFTGVPATVVGSDGHTYSITGNGSGTFKLNKSQYQAIPVGSAVVLTFNYTVTAGALSSTAQAKVIVIGTNDGPDAVDDFIGTITEGTVINVAVLGNDSDPDNDPIHVTKINSITIDGVVITDPAQIADYVTILPSGQLNVDTSSIEKDHNYDIVVNYEIADPYGLTDNANVYLNVTNVNKVIYYGDSENDSLTVITEAANASNTEILTSQTITEVVRNYIDNTVILDDADAYGDLGALILTATAGNATAFASSIVNGGTEHAIAITDAAIQESRFNFGDDTITVNRGLIVGDVGTLSMLGDQGDASATFALDCFAPYSEAHANVAIRNNTFNFGHDNLTIGKGDVIGDVQQLTFNYTDGTATGNGTLNDDDNWNFGNTFNFGDDTISAREGTLTGDLAKVTVNGTTYDMSIAAQLAAFQATAAYTANTFHFGHDTFVLNASEALDVTITDFGIGGANDVLEITGLLDVNGGGIDYTDLVDRSEVVNNAGHIQLNIDLNNDGIVDSTIDFTNIAYNAADHEITDYLSSSDIIGSI